jgi:hypothetical protein
MRRCVGPDALDQGGQRGPVVRVLDQARCGQLSQTERHRVQSGLDVDHPVQHRRGLAVPERPGPGCREHDQAAE